jgi:hypothetical protein
MSLQRFLDVLPRAAQCNPGVIDVWQDHITRYAKNSKYLNKLTDAWVTDDVRELAQTHFRGLLARARYHFQIQRYLHPMLKIRET